MNLILFDRPFEKIRLEADDPRAKHIRKVLRAVVGTKVFIGFINNVRARAEVTEITQEGGVDLTVIAAEPSPKPLPIRLLLGLPRPHTAKRILFEAASLGVSELHFFEAERGEPSYAQSSLWSTDEWKERLHLGAEQSFTTHIPEVGMHTDHQSALSHLYEADVRIALDNYEATGAIGDFLQAEQKSAVIALGSERGWSPTERETFIKNGWKLAHLGSRVLRAETAATVAVASVASHLGFWLEQTQTEI